MRRKVLNKGLIGRSVNGWGLERNLQAIPVNSPAFRACGSRLGMDLKQDARFPFDYMIFAPRCRHEIKIAKKPNFGYQIVNKSHTSALTWCR